LAEPGAKVEARLRGSNVRLFSYLEELARRQSLEIGGMNDKGSQAIGESKINEQAVEVTFTRISLDKLVKFLQEVEGGGGIVKITRLQIRPRKDEPVIDAWLTVTTYQMAG
ncbi:MAG: type II secretion system protein GspM, partial [Myxococcales bacterium]